MPYSFNNIPIPDQLVYAGRSPSLAHPFGETGGLQRDVMELVVNGARTSLFIGFGSMILGVLIGTHRRALSADRRLVLRGVPPRIMRVLAVTRLNRVLHVEAPAAAVA